MSLVSDPTNVNNLWMGTYSDLYQTNDGGSSWSSLGLEYTDAYPFGINGLIEKSASPVDILCSTYGKGVINYNDGNWNIGNGPFGGIVNKLVMHPDNHENLYACTQYGGLFQSTNGSSNWEYQSHGNIGWLRDMSFAPSNSNIVYLLGDRVFSYSNNGGADWSATNLLDYYLSWYNNQIVVSPNDPGVVLICGQFYDQSWNRWNGIIKSSDYGNTWEVVYDLETQYWSYLKNFVVDPFDDNHIIAGGYFYDNQNVWQHILVESYNMGSTWNEISLPDLGNSRLYAFNYSPYDAQTLFASFSYGELYKSVDNGLNWEWMYSGNTAFVIEWDLAYSQTLYMGTWAGISKSTDGGYTWIDISLEEQNTSEITSIVQDPVTPDIIYASSTDGYGIFKSTDRGDSWTPSVEGLYNVTFLNNGLTQDPVNNNILYAATYRNGLFKSVDGGDSWDKLPESPGSLYDYYATKVSESNSTVIYASGPRRFHKSGDSGQNWESYYFNSGEYGGYIYPFDIETNNSLPNDIYMAGYFYNYDDNIRYPILIHSQDNGSTWQVIYMSMAVEMAFIYDLELDPQNSSIMYACGYMSLADTDSPQIEPVITEISDIPNDQGGRVYLEFEKSIFDTDNINRVVEGYQVERLDDIGWVGVGSYNAYGSETYIIEVNTLIDSSNSTDGLTVFRVWANMDEGNYASEPDSGYSVDNIAPSMPGGLMTSSVDDGVYLSWQPNEDEDLQYYAIYKSTQDGFNPDTMNAAVFETIETEYTDTFTTFGLVYYYRISAVDIHGNESEYSEQAESQLAIEEDILPIQFALHQNYPNPFNPVTTLRYELSEQSFVRITINDILGREVRNLVNGVEEPGFKSVIWDGKNDAGQTLGAGVYLYRIQTKDFRQTNKMILLK